MLNVVATGEDRAVVVDDDVLGRTLAVLAEAVVLEAGVVGLATLLLLLLLLLLTAVELDAVDV